MSRFHGRVVVTDQRKTAPFEQCAILGLLEEDHVGLSFWKAASVEFHGEMAGEHFAMHSHLADDASSARLRYRKAASNARLHCRQAPLSARQHYRRAATSAGFGYGEAVSFEAHAALTGFWKAASDASREAPSEHHSIYYPSDGPDRGALDAGKASSVEAQAKAAAAAARKKAFDNAKAKGKDDKAANEEADAAYNEAYEKKKKTASNLHRGGARNVG